MAQGISLHIGLDEVDPGHYDGWSGPLNACEADAASMEMICSAQGFATERLLTRHATRHAVASKIEKAAATLKAGDTFLLSYSGHGGQLPDPNRDEEDGLDETWCLYDGELVDDELYELWGKFKPGVRVLMVSDSCHSGTVLRNALTAQLSVASVEGGGHPVAFRLMPPSVQRRTYAANRSFYDKILKRPAPPPEPSCTVVLMSGCQDNQLSMDGAFNGAFTGALLVIWDNGRFKGGYEAFVKQIRKLMPATQSPNYVASGAANSAFTSGQVFSI